MTKQSHMTVTFFFIVCPIHFFRLNILTTLKGPCWPLCSQSDSNIMLT
jgi:hypothetical protein